VTPFDDTHPGVAKLDPDLLEALRTAATDAAHDGIKVYVSSGWRSPKDQN
jgi:zinc D-Ala-D-Ala carboxypeptidase